jgi:hypothetical protein
MARTNHARDGGEAAVMDRVRELNEEIATERELATTAWHTFEQKRIKLAASKAAKDPQSAEFQEAEQASKSYEKIATSVRAKEEARERLMAIHSTGVAPSGNGNGPQDGNRSGHGPRDQYKPGEWLAAMLTADPRHPKHREDFGATGGVS